VNFLALKQV